MILTIDFETRSECDLKTAGVWKYAEHPSTRILCLGIKVAGMTPELWWPDWTGMKGLRTSDLACLLLDAEYIYAHNAEFETAMWQLMPIPLPLEKLRCTAAMAAYHALPRALDNCAKALGLSTGKDAEGYKLMMKMCKPQTDRKTKDKFWIEDPASLQRLGEYCKQDCEVEYQVCKRLRQLPETEQEVWRVDQIINRRGVAIDTTLVKEAMRVGEEQQDRFKAEMKGLIGCTPNQVASVLWFVNDKGFTLSELTKDSVSKALAGDLPPTIRRVLEIRQSAARTSSAKYAAMAKRVSADGRARSLFMYHAATTGRWGGKSIQPQNMPSRGVISDPDGAIEVISRGASAEEIEWLWGDTMQVLSSCTRGAIIAPPGKDLICSDYSAIEGRVLAWVVGEEFILEAYRNGDDLYKIAASGAFHKPYNAITKFERSIGKVITLACIAEGQLVTTDRGLVPIEKVTKKDLVFDGIDFVKHGGVVYQGVKEVITYEGLTATSDHRVFIKSAGEYREIQFGLAAASGSHLATPEGRGQGLREREGHCTRGQIHPRMVGAIHADRMRGLRQKTVDQHLESVSGAESGVSDVFPTGTRVSEMALQEIYGGEKQMHESERPRPQRLRGPGNTVPLSLRPGSMSSHARSLRYSRAGNGDRPNEQQRELRTGKCSLCHATREQKQYATVENTFGVCLPPRGVALRPQYSNAENAGGEDPRADIGRRQTRGEGKEKRLAENKVTARVYDILNCGPRNRYVVSSKLVHNCGYQGGSHAFLAMAKSYGIDEIPEEEAKEIVKAWRENRPKTVAFWRDLQAAAINAIENPGSLFICQKTIWGVKDGYLCCKLPGGRTLRYPNPSVGEKPAPWDEKKMIPVINFWGNDINNHWVQLETYGGRLCENVVQAIARDLLAEALVRVEKHGKYQVVISCHDELLSEVEEGKGNMGEYNELLTRLPSWGAGLPLEAEGWIGKRYRK